MAIIHPDMGGYIVRVCLGLAFISPCEAVRLGFNAAPCQLLLTQKYNILLQVAMQQAATDPETGLIDMVSFYKSEW